MGWFTINEWEWLPSFQVTGWLCEFLWSLLKQEQTANQFYYSFSPSEQIFSMYFKPLHLFSSFLPLWFVAFVGFHWVRTAWSAWRPLDQQGAVEFSFQAPTVVPKLYCSSFPPVWTKRDAPEAYFFKISCVFVTLRAGVVIIMELVSLGVCWTWLEEEGPNIKSKRRTKTNIKRKINKQQKKNIHKEDKNRKS